MFRVDPDLVSRYLSQVNFTDENLQFEFSQSIADCLTRCVKGFVSNRNFQKNIEKLALHISALTEQTNTETVLHVIQALKIFIASQDFAFPNKHKVKVVKPYFLGEVKLSFFAGGLECKVLDEDNALMKSLLTCLNTLEYEYQSKVTQEQKSKPETNQTAHQDASNSNSHFLYSESNYLKAGFLAFISFSSLAIVKSNSIQYLNDNTLPMFYGPATYDSNYWQQKYHIISNVEFEKIKFYFVGNIHTNATHYYLFRDLLEAQGKPGDAVLLESIPSMDVVRCDKLEFNDCLDCKDFSLSSKWKCVGSDAAAAYQESQEYKQNIFAMQKDVLDIRKVTQKLPNLIQKFLEIAQENSVAGKAKKQQLVLTELKEIIAFLESANKNHSGILPSSMDEVFAHISKFEKDFNANSFERILNIINSSINNFVALSNKVLSSRGEETLIVSRNKNGYIATLEKVKKWGVNIFGFWGTKHYVPDLNNPLAPISKKDPQYEFQEYIKGLPHGVFIPKK